jgi:hypothetical protein
VLGVSDAVVVGGVVVGGVVVGGVVVGGVVGMVGFAKTADVDDGSAVIGAVDVWSVALLVASLPQAAAMRSPAPRVVTLT